MKLSQPTADIFVPDGSPVAAALARTTHLCIAAHQDDIEIMAWHGIAECHDSKDRWFTGVVVTDGSGSPRAGKFANHNDEQMKAVRREEQRAAHTALAASTESPDVVIVGKAVCSAMVCTFCPAKVFLPPELKPAGMPPRMVSRSKIEPTSAKNGSARWPAKTLTPPLRV